MAGEHIRFELATPIRVVDSGEAEQVVIPAAHGQAGIMPGHDPFLTTLATGIMIARCGDGERKYFVDHGFAEVSADAVVILAEVAERSDEIDAKRARAAKERAEQRLKQPIGEDIDVARAEAALMRALYRLQLAES